MSGELEHLEVIGDPSIFNIIRSAAVLVTMWPTLDLRCEENTKRRKWKLVYDELLKMQENGQFLDEPAKIEDKQIHSVDDQTY